jgi:hypothetical protein
MDPNFWKDKYKPHWEKAAQREKLVKETIEKETGHVVETFGFGAGSTAYYSGSAAANGYEKNGSDLYINDLDIYIEVTGPHIPVDPEAALWVRPDKIKNSLRKLNQGIGSAHFIVHIIDLKNPTDKLMLARVIPITEELLTFQLIYPQLFGTAEPYLEIPASYSKLLTFKSFLDFINRK